MNTPTQVLLVDDDARLGYDAGGIPVCEELLKYSRFTTAKQALSGRYAIAVIDVMMPSRERSGSLAPNSPSEPHSVIMLTARGDDVDRIVGFELGPDNYFPKPCTSRELLARIRAILRRARPYDRIDRFSSLSVIFFEPVRRIGAGGVDLQP